MHKCVHAHTRGINYFFNVVTSAVECGFQNNLSLSSPHMVTYIWLKINCSLFPLEKELYLTSVLRTDTREVVTVDWYKLVNNTRG